MPELLKIRQLSTPLLKTEVKTFAVGKGQYNVNLDDIFQEKIPNRLILGIVSADAYAGNLTKNPFNFKHYNFDFMCLYANGQSVPSKALQPKFASDNYVEAFQTLFTGIELDGKDAGLQCSREDYGKGYTLVVLEFRSDRHSNSSRKETRQFTAGNKICLCLTRSHQCDTIC